MFLLQCLWFLLCRSLQCKTKVPPVFNKIKTEPQRPLLTISPELPFLTLPYPPQANILDGCPKFLFSLHLDIQLTLLIQRFQWPSLFRVPFLLLPYLISRLYFVQMEILSFFKHISSLASVISISPDFPFYFSLGPLSLYPFLLASSVNSLFCLALTCSSFPGICQDSFSSQYTLSLGSSLCLA